MKPELTDGPAATNGESPQLEASSGQGHAAIHLVRVPDLEARKRAFHVLIATAESWVRLPGYVMGVSTRQVEALTRGQVPFDWVSKTPCNG